jgi:BASS family bile acid:Na+ symporter
VGMGLTLTINDFALVFKKPLAMILGPIFQFLFMPLLAMLLGYISGYYETYPFIYLGMLLIAVTPGGVTSNLMTYLGKGDVALSVSLTALCTVLSLFCTPLILTLFAAHIPSFQLPVMAIFSQILILVVIPLFIGMLVRSKSENFAKKAEKPFAGIGLFALLFLIVVGIWGNLEKFADTDRYGFKFYAIIFVFTLVGMIGSGLLAKLLRINNFQARAVSLECGLRNASLAMTIALLIQDRIGDFYSSVFFTSGIFGIWMYFAGAISIFTFKKWLPVSSSTDKA